MQINFRLIYERQPKKVVLVKLLTNCNQTVIKIFILTISNGTCNLKGVIPILRMRLAAVLLIVIGSATARYSTGSKCLKCTSEHEIKGNFAHFQTVLNHYDKSSYMQMNNKHLYLPVSRAPHSFNHKKLLGQGILCETLILPSHFCIPLYLFNTYIRPLYFSLSSRLKYFRNQQTKRTV